MAVHSYVPRGRLWSRHAAIATVALCGAKAVVDLLALRGLGPVSPAMAAGTLNTPVPGSFPPGLPGSLSPVERHAEEPVEKPQEDLGKELAKAMADIYGFNDRITPADRITPIDRWFGWDKTILAGLAADSEAFVDSQVEANYVTLVLQRPLGIEFAENTPGEGGGIMVGDVIPGYSASASGLIKPGYHLILAEDTPVYGLPFEEAVRPITDKEGPVKLTFFMGEAVHFYGEYRPSTAWLNKFFKAVKERQPPCIQAPEA